MRSWALANPKADEREVLADMLTGDQDLLATHPGQTIVGDKGYVSKHLDTFMGEHGLALLRPSYRNRTPRPGEHLLKPIRQLIESVNDTDRQAAGCAEQVQAQAPEEAGVRGAVAVSGPAGQVGAFDRGS